MNVKEINTATSVNWVQVNADGTNSYFGTLGNKWLFNTRLQDILREYHAGGDQYHCHLHVWDISDINNPYLVATQRSDMRADSYMNNDRVLIILERVAKKVN